jgi:hypothetical protein
MSRSWTVRAYVDNTFATDAMNCLVIQCSYCSLLLRLYHTKCVLLNGKQDCYPYQPARWLHVPLHAVPNSTVKAPNFGPHGNFGPLFQNGLLSLKRVLQKMKRIKVVEELWIYKFGSVHFLYMIHPQNLQSLQEKVQSFHEVQSSWRLLRYSRQLYTTPTLYYCTTLPGPLAAEPEFTVTHSTRLWQPHS